MLNKSIIFDFLVLMQQLAAISVRTIAKWGGSGTALIGTALIVASAVKAGSLKRALQRLRTDALRKLKGQERLRAHMKAHQLENSLENMQFYKTLGIVLLAGGGSALAAGWLWPKDEEGSGSQLDPSLPMLPLFPKLTWRRDGDFEIALAVDDHQPQSVLLEGTQYVPVAVASDGDCLIHAALFPEWHGPQENKQELPGMFRVTSARASVIRTAMVAQMQEYIDSELVSFGEFTLAQYEAQRGRLQEGYIVRLFSRFESVTLQREKIRPGDGVSESKGDDIGEYVDDFIYDYQALTGYKYSRGNPSVLKEAAALRALLSRDEGRAAWIEQLPSFSAQIQTVASDHLFTGEERLPFEVYTSYLVAVKNQSRAGFPAVSAFLKRSVTMTQVCAQYMELYNRYVGLQGVQPREVGPQHYLGGRDGELLARVINKKIVVSQPGANFETWGAGLPAEASTVFVQHVNGNHWEALVPQEVLAPVDMQVGAGAGAGAGSA
jgi:hypothetical protein